MEDFAQQGQGLPMNRRNPIADGQNPQLAVVEKQAAAPNPFPRRFPNNVAPQPAFQRPVGLAKPFERDRQMELDGKRVDTTIVGVTVKHVKLSIDGAAAWYSKDRLAVEDARWVSANRADIRDDIWSTNAPGRKQQIYDRLYKDAQARRNLRSFYQERRARRNAAMGQLAWNRMGF